MPGLSPNGFPTIVNSYLPPGAPGKFAGANIKANAVAGQGAFVATAAGTIVGNMGWADEAAGVLTNYYRPNSAPCFVLESLNALITQYLGTYTLTIPQGFEVTGMVSGDYWGNFTAAATPQQKVYADPVTGALTANATGNSVTASLSSGGGSVTSGVLTTTDADATGTIAVGQIVIDSTGVLPLGTYIAAANGTGSGTHLWILANADNAVIPNVSAGTVTWAFYGVQETPFTVSSVVVADASITSATIAAPVFPAIFAVMTVTSVTGKLVAGQYLSSTGILATANAQILYQISGTAGGGGGATYAVSNVPGAISGQTITATQGKIGKITHF
jgi:hypothetical protein